MTDGRPAGERPERVQGSATGRTLTPLDVAYLSEREALQRLDLLAKASSVLDSVVDDYEPALREVAEACTEDFADLCVIEVLDPSGAPQAVAMRHSPGHGLALPKEWSALGSSVAGSKGPVLAFEGSDPPAAAAARRRLGARSLIVAPISAGGGAVGWFVAATGPDRRGFRPSALKVAVDLSRRMGSAIQRVTLHGEMQASAAEQARTVLRLRRLAAAATNLAGAATPMGVLDTACREACVIHEADAAVARWTKPDGSVVEASAGRFDRAAVEAALEAVTPGRVSRGENWIAYPLPSSDPWQHGTLVVFAAGDFSGEEPVLSSLASLVPVAFERALGTETALKHEARLRAVVDSSPVALVEVTPGGGVSMANRTAQELFGWGPVPGTWSFEDAIQVPLDELISEVLATGSVSHRTVRTATQEMSVSGAPLPPVQSTGETSILLAAVDLSEMRRAQMALVQAQRLEAMGQVAGRVAHDFNNLLTLIIGYAAILRRSITEDAQNTLLDNIVDASKRAAQLTQQMLDMTRQKTDSGVVIDLGEAVAALDAVLARVAGPKVRLSIRTAPERTLVRLDPSEMEQIVLNLVINACDAMDTEGRIDIEVGIAAGRTTEGAGLELPPGPLARLNVTDDGPGMPPEVLARCLEPFFTTKDRGHGSGLGLPTVYGLVRERGGQMQIDSEPGRGTSIKIWLPLETSAELTGAGGPLESWPADERVHGRVLLVEDESELGAIAADTLTSVGLEVRLFATGETALTALRSGEHFDGLITDVMLPGMSGPDLVVAARRIDPDLPVVYMTGYAGTHQLPSRASDPVLQKPYTPDLLRLRAAQMVRQGRRRRAGQGSKR